MHAKRPSFPLDATVVPRLAASVIHAYTHIFIQEMKTIYTYIHIYTSIHIYTRNEDNNDPYDCKRACIIEAKQDLNYTK